MTTRENCPWKCKPGDAACLCAGPEPTHECDVCCTTLVGPCENVPCHARPIPAPSPTADEGEE